MRFYLLILLGLASGLSHAENAPIRLKDWQAEIVRDFEVLYAPLMQETGRRLEMVWRWESPSVVASIDTDGQRLKIIADGGLLRSSRLSPDAFRFTLCHEMGHLLGGAPRRHPPMEWDGPMAADGLLLVSSEGQADYYASLSCFRHLINGQNHRQALAGVEISPRLQRLCEQSWGADTDEALVCVRAAIGGYDLLQLVKDFSISFENPDSSVVPKLIRNAYPPRQCRLDTILAGALCRSTAALELDFNDSTANDCPETSARRPLCWYRQ